MLLIMLFWCIEVMITLFLYCFYMLLTCSAADSLTSIKARRLLVILSEAGWKWNVFLLQTVSRRSNKGTSEIVLNQCCVSTKHRPIKRGDWREKETWRTLTSNVLCVPSDSLSYGSAVGPHTHWWTMNRRNFEDSSFFYVPDCFWFVTRETKDLRSVVSHVQHASWDLRLPGFSLQSLP